ncbi:hypothetical protein ES703_12186 [subsurface metagenome]
MGWLIVPDITDERVVCQSPCNHRDCAVMREQWGESKCRICGEGFKAGQRFYYEDGVAIHADCLEDETLKQTQR